MVSKDRMITEFMELVRIDSLSKKERHMADFLKAKLEGMGIEVFEDDAGRAIGGDAGNLICNLPGDKKVPAVLLMAHMDTVIPGIGKKPVLDGDIIRSDGTTVLGGDDGAGIVTILEAIRVLKEDAIPHGDIQIAFTIAEEIGLCGAKNLNYDKIHAKYGFVMDSSGGIGFVATKAPSHNRIYADILGKAAHAGLEPEKGISAIVIAARAISAMTIGRIDEETTANIGIISGGHATNIVTDKVEVKGEARSRDPQKLEKQTSHMVKCFRDAASEMGGKAEVRVENEYPSFDISEDQPIIGILKKAAEGIGLPLRLEATGGGSDTNIINGKGIQAVDIGVGMDKVHSVEERIKTEDLEKAAWFLVEILKNVE